MSLPLYTSEDSGDPSIATGYLQKLNAHITQNILNTSEIEAARQGAVDLVTNLINRSAAMRAYVEFYVDSVSITGADPADIPLIEISKQNYFVGGV